MSLVYDVAIMGGGPSGMAAALTCANQGLHCLLLSDQRGGKLGGITQLTNWFGGTSTNGKQLADALHAQLKEHKAHITVKQSRVVTINAAANKDDEKLFTIMSEDGGQAIAKTLIIATGTRRKQLGVLGEQALTGKGVSYCAICDIPYFRRKKVALVHNGAHPFLAADELARQASEVFLFTTALGKPATQNVHVINTVDIREITGTERVTGLAYREAPSKPKVSLAIDAVFVECGAVGNSDAISHIVKVDENGFVEIDHATMATSLPGVFAAGDVTNGRYKQVALAMADGTRAALSAKKYIQAKEAI